MSSRSGSSVGSPSSPSSSSVSSVNAGYALIVSANILALSSSDQGLPATSVLRASRLKPPHLSHASPASLFVVGNAGVGGAGGGAGVGVGGGVGVGADVGVG